jgi:predicted aspartyl protease
MVHGALRPTGSPVVPIEIAGQTLEAVLDTGFEGGLQLLVAFAGVVNPIFRVHQPTQYADGRIELVPIFDVVVVFDGQPCVMRTQFADSDEIMLGVDALKDYRLEINFVAGSVLLERVAP